MKNTDILHDQAVPRIACPAMPAKDLQAEAYRHPAADDLDDAPPRGAILDEPQTLLGYEVENTHNPNIFEPAYILHGSKGATFVLMRNEENNAMLLAINIRHYSIASIKGYSWFTDSSGRLKPVS